MFHVLYGRNDVRLARNSASLCKTHVACQIILFGVVQTLAYFLSLKRAINCPFPQWVTGLLPGPVFTDPGVRQLRSMRGPRVRVCTSSLYLPVEITVCRQFPCPRHLIIMVTRVIVDSQRSKRRNPTFNYIKRGWEPRLQNASAKGFETSCPLCFPTSFLALPVAWATHGSRIPALKRSILSLALHAHRDLSRRSSWRTN